MTLVVVMSRSIQQNRNERTKEKSPVSLVERKRELRKSGEVWNEKCFKEGQIGEEMKKEWRIEKFGGVKEEKRRRPDAKF
ncbi:conserved hypothetical protein [Ricinus communis]|uniref:Uncharacterized protein n=1 Tax=Ricinus communis TaxID=3988 RepID=B9SQ98_RICCO|nr:conserved hypothetical protein [Ricinus communis]